MESLLFAALWREFQWFLPQQSWKCGVCTASTVTLEAITAPQLCTTPFSRVPFRGSVLPAGVNRCSHTESLDILLSDRSFVPYSHQDGQSDPLLYWSLLSVTASIKVIMLLMPVVKLIGLRERSLKTGFRTCQDTCTAAGQMWKYFTIFNRKCHFYL